MPSNYESRWKTGTLSTKFIDGVLASPYGWTHYYNDLTRPYRKNRNQQRQMVTNWLYCNYERCIEIFEITHHFIRIYQSFQTFNKNVYIVIKVKIWNSRLDKSIGTLIFANSRSNVSFASICSAVFIHIRILMFDEARHWGVLFLLLYVKDIQLVVKITKSHFNCQTKYFD